MSISYSVRNLLAPDSFWRYARPRADSDRVLHVAARLWLDGDGARLYDHDAGQSAAQSIVLADPEACAALRAALPGPGDYLGDILLLARIRLGREGPELHSAYWIVLGELNAEATRWDSGQRIDFRPVPAGYEDGGR